MRRPRWMSATKPLRSTSRWSVIAGALLLICPLLLAIQVAHQQQAEQHHQMAQRLQQQAIITAQVIARWEQQRQSDALLLAMHPAVTASLRTITAANGEDRATTGSTNASRSPITKPLPRSSHGTLFVASPDGIIQVTSHTGSTPPPRLNVIPADLLERRAQSSDWNDSGPRNDDLVSDVLTSISPLEQPRKLLGLLILRSSFKEELLPLLAQSIQPGTGTRTYLLRRQGLHREAIGVAPTTVNSEKRGFSRLILPPDERFAHSSATPWSLERSALGDERLLIATQTIDGSPWLVLCTLPEAEAEQLAPANRSLLFLLFASSLLGCCLLAWLVPKPPPVADPPPVLPPGLPLALEPQRLLAQWMAHAPIGMAAVDPESRHFTQANPLFLQLFSWQNEKLPEHGLDEALARTAPGKDRDYLTLSTSGLSCGDHSILLCFAISHAEHLRKEALLEQTIAQLRTSLASYPPPAPAITAPTASHASHAPITSIQLTARPQASLTAMQSEASDHDKRLQSLRENSDFDVTAGLTAVGGKVGRYLDLLGKYLQHHEHLLTELEHHLKHQDFSAAQRLAHTLKGAASTLGLRTTSRCAQSLEHALRDHLHPLPEQLFSDLQTAHAQQCTAIRALLPEPRSPEAAEVRQPGTALSADQVEQLQTLGHLLRDDDMRSNEQARVLEGVLANQLGDQHQRFKRLLDQFDYPGALAILEARLPNPAEKHIPSQG